MTKSAGELIERWASQISTSTPGELWQLEESLSGALAAVRLEAIASLRADCLGLMAKWRKHGKAQDTRGLAFGVDGEDFRDCANDLEVALERAGERAVEGK